MVAIDANTLQIKRYTPLFTFEKECVEYTLGFAPFNENKNKDSEQFIIGYSRMDRSTEYKVVDKKWFEGMFNRLRGRGTKVPL